MMMSVFILADDVKDKLLVHTVSRGIAGANFNFIPFLDSDIYGDVEPEAT